MDYTKEIIEILDTISLELVDSKSTFMRASSCEGQDKKDLIAEGIKLDQIASARFRTLVQVFGADKIDEIQKIRRGQKY
jgi:hypothetical protein